jgi:putative membrane protein
MAPEPLSQDAADDTLVGGSPATELASNRTALAFERTRLATDRTLMATVRTSLSLISFGFTINEVFLQWHEQNDESVVGGAASYFGLGLVLLGVVVLTMGVIGHRRIMRLLVERRERLFRLGLVRHTQEYEATATFVAAVVLLLLGLVAAGSIILRSIV